MNAQIYWNAACMYGSIPAYYRTYIVQVRGHARLRWVKMRCDEGGLWMAGSWVPQSVAR